MIVQCQTCKMWFEDVYRSTLCPHDAFPANDGNNNFKVHDDAWLSADPPPDRVVCDRRLLGLDDEAQA